MLQKKSVPWYLTKNAKCQKMKNALTVRTRFSFRVKETSTACEDTVRSAIYDEQWNKVYDEVNQVDHLWEGQLGERITVPVCFLLKKSNVVDALYYRIVDTENKTQAKFFLPPSSEELAGLIVFLQPLFGISDVSNIVATFVFGCIDTTVHFSI
jgi:hypothetical protein